MKNMNRSTVTFIIIGALTLLLAGGLSLFASSHPDGLERVAHDQGFLERERADWLLALFPDYSTGSGETHWLVQSAIGVFGAGLMFLVLWLLGKWLARKR